MKTKLSSLFIIFTLLFSFVPAAWANAAVKNADFEDGTASWNLAEAASITSGGYQSSHALLQTGTGDTSQTLSSLADGYYALTAYAMYSGGGNNCYLYADGVSTASTAIPVSKDEWVLVTVRGIEISNGSVKVGIRTTMPDSSSVKLDQVTLSRTDKPYTFLKGGDITELTYVEACGGRFYDQSGIEKDALQILAEQGMNIARIRVYNSPGKGHGEGGYYLPEYYQSAEDALNLARRAKAKGMQIQLTFHYSDYWTNGSRQLIPSEWQAQIDGLSDTEAIDRLEQLVYDYTLDVMSKMDAQGTLPEYVSLGNEIQGGMLYPYGRNKNWDALSRFLNAGSSAVKAVSKNTKIILHLDDAGNTDRYNNFFGNCEKYGVQYDIIGPSYYPFWTKRTVSEVVDFCNTMVDTFDKDIMIMETGFNFHPTKPDGYAGQLSDNGPYENTYPSSPEGQRDFLYELYSGLKNVKDGRCLGDLYWDPVMISCDGVGWAMKEEDDTADTNVVANTTLFDFDGKALPALDAFRYNQNATSDYTITGKVTDKAGTPASCMTLGLSTGSAPSDTHPIQCDSYGYYFAQLPAFTDAQIRLYAPDGKPDTTLAKITAAPAGELLTGIDVSVERTGQKIGDFFVTVYAGEQDSLSLTIQNITNRSDTAALFAVTYDETKKLKEVSTYSFSLKSSASIQYSYDSIQGEHTACYLWDGTNLSPITISSNDSL